MRYLIDFRKTACATLAFGLVTIGAVQAQDRLNLTSPTGNRAHIYPTVELNAQIKAERRSMSLTNVTYHGGRIMTAVQIYAIYWAPPTLQDGTATVMPAAYEGLLNRMLSNYAGHSIANVNTQYSQIVSGITSYHTGLGSLAGIQIDTTAFPTRVCTDTATPKNCLTDAQLQSEISHVMTVRGWTAGFNKIFLLFTPKGMGQCFTSVTSCSYTQYCAYHSFFGSVTNPVIYGNEPYGTAPGGACQLSGITTPNVPTEADSAATAARHEVSEATTDPELDAWFDSGTGEETSDKCNFDYGPKTWDGGKANYFWGGKFLLLQREYSNHTGTCVTEGPSGP